MLRRICFLAVVTLSTALPGAAQAPTLRMRGSDSIDPLIRLWMSEFQKTHAEVAFEVESKGSATAPPALLSGEADLGHMSREMNAAEHAAFVAKHGAPPVGFVVAFDALAVFVHKDNPLKRVTVEQLDAIYSTTRKAGWELPLDQWGDLFLRGPLKRQPIQAYTRDERSGSRAFFMEKVLLKDGIMRSEVKVEDQAGIMDALGRTPNAIGYGPESYASPLVRMVPLAGPRSGKALLPTTETIQSGRYALARKLLIYTCQKPGEPLTPHARAFLRFILSADGQELAKRHGSVPLSPALLEQEAARLN